MRHVIHTKPILLFLTIISITFSLSGCGKMSESYRNEKFLYMMNYNPPLILNAPVNVSATDGEYNDRVIITWNQVKEAQFYRVFRSETEEGEYTQIGGDITMPLTCMDTSGDQGAIYFYKVQALHEEDDSELSEYDSGSIGTFPNEPSWITASTGTFTDKIEISWESIADAEYYWVYRSNQSSGPYVKISGDVSAATYDDMVSAGPHYFYKIKAANGGGESNLSITAEGYALEGEALAPPSGVSATDKVDNDTEKVTVSWSSVTDADFYRVYRCLTVDGDYDQVSGDVTSTSFQDTDTYEDTVYYYKVKAFSSTKESEFSDYDEGSSEITHLEYLRRFNFNRAYALSRLTFETSFPPGGLGDPTEFQIIGTNGGTLDVNVEVDVFGGKAVTNMIYTDYDDIGMILNGTEITDTDFSGTGINTGNTASTGSDIGSVSSTLNVVNKVPESGDYTVTYRGTNQTFNHATYWAAPLSAPGNVRATDGIYTDKVTVSWLPVYGADYYRVYRADTADGIYSQIGDDIIGSLTPENGTIYTYEDTSATPDIHYFYKVKAFNAYILNDENGNGADDDPDLEGPLSDYNEGHAQSAGFLAPPDNVSATDGIYPDTIRISWDPVGIATYYRVYRSDTSDGTYTQVAGSGDITGTSFEDATVSVATVYYYRVKSFNVADESDFSDFDSGIASSGEARLNTMAISIGTLTPTFDSDITSYVVEVPYDTESMDVTVTPIDGDATVEINSSTATAGVPVSIDLSSLPADGGISTLDILIDVTANGGAPTLQYQITVSKELAPFDEARLSNLTVSQGSLNPGFNTDTFAYSVEVSEGTSSIDVTPTALDEDYATIKVEGISVTSGSPSTVNLVSFPYEIEIDVTAGNGADTEQYVITIEEEAGCGGGGGGGCGG